MSNLQAINIRRLFENTQSLRRDPLDFFQRLSKKGNTVIPVELSGKTLYFLNHPDAIAHVFRGNSKNYVRSSYYDRLRPFIGQSLFTSEGEEWRRQRANSQPAMHGPNLKAMVNVMNRILLEKVEYLHEFAVRGEPIGGFRFFASTFLDIALQCLFGSKLPPKVFENVFDDLAIILRILEKRLWAIVPVPLIIPTQENRQFKSAILRLQRVVGDIVDLRWNEQTDGPDDFLAMIIAHEKIQTGGAKARILVIDQCMAMLLAGHETGSSSLFWGMLSTSRAPEIASRVAAENSKLPESKDIELNDLRDMTYTERVLKEALRLYPPAWSYTRTALKDDVICGHAIPKGASVILCTYMIHRLPDFWPEPDRFDPERFTGEKNETRHPFVYFPFAGGRNMCLGNRFAMTEGVLALSHFLANFEFELLPGQDVRPVPATTLRPSCDAKFYVKPRRLENGIPAAFIETAGWSAANATAPALS